MSICIVHKDGWAVCDSRETMNFTIIPTISKKIVKADGCLIASVGVGALGSGIQKIVEAQGHEVDVLEAVAEMMSQEKFDGDALACTYKRELVIIDAGGYISYLDCDFWATGSCEGYVLGRLQHIAESRTVTIEDATEAIVKASGFDVTIDARVQKFWLSQM